MIKDRPAGVTFISILNVFSGVFLIMLGLIFLGLVGSESIEQYIQFAMPMFSFAGISGIIMLLGAFQLVIAYGLWSLKKWALYLYLFSLFLSIFSSLITSGLLFFVVFQVIIAVYLIMKRECFN